MKRSSSKTKIFTCADTFKNDYVTRVVKPDIGSLNDFLGGTFDLSAKKTTKKSKAQIEQQKWNETLHDLKKMMSYEKKTLKELLIYEKEDRTRQGASRLIIEEIFQTVFEKAPEQFYSKYDQKLMQQRFYKYKIVKPGYSEAVFYENELSKEVQDFKQQDPDKLTFERFASFQNYLKHKKRENERKIQTIKEIENQKNNSDRDRKTTLKLFDVTFSHFIENAPPKAKRKQLQKLGVWPSQPKGEKIFYEDNEVYEQAYLQRWEKWMYYERSNDDKRDKQEDKDQCAYFGNNIIFLQNCQFQHAPFLETLVEVVRLASIKTVFVRNCRLTAESLAGLIAVLSSFSKLIENVVLSKIDCSQLIALQIKRLIQISKLKILIYDDANITTKMFCMMAIGMGESNSILDIRMRKNSIDSRASRAIQILLRYIKSLAVFDLSGSHIPEKEIRTIMGEVKDKRKKVKLK